MKNSEQKDGVLVRRVVAEYGCALAFLIVGAVIMWDSYHIGAGWGDRGPMSGYFPMRIGIIICLAAFAVMIETWRKRPADDDAFVTREQIKPVLKVFFPIVAFVIVMDYLGIYVASVVLIAGFMRLLGKYGWLKSLLVGVGVSAVMFWLFEIEFMVPLVKGPLEAAFGY